MNKKGITTKASKKAFLDAMVKTLGNVTQSAKIAGISRESVYNWKDEDEEFKAEFESDKYENMFMDAIEGKLKKVGLQDENPTVLIFLAKTKCKSRGYVEKTEVDVNGRSAEKVKELFPTVEDYKNALEKPQS